jgi:hypothetical protein
MKLAFLILVVAFGVAAPAVASASQGAKENRPRFEKPEKSRCFAWPGGCTGR